MVLYCNLNAETAAESSKSELKSESSSSFSMTTIIVSSADGKLPPVPILIFCFFVGFFPASRSRRFSALHRLPYFEAREAISSSRKRTSFFSSTRWSGRVVLIWYCAGQPGGISGKRDLHYAFTRY